MATTSDESSYIVPIPYQLDFGPETTEPLAQITVINADKGDCNVVDLCCKQFSPATGYPWSSWTRWLIDTGPGTPNGSHNMAILVAILRVIGNGKLPRVYTAPDTVCPMADPQVPNVSLVQITHPDNDHYGNALGVLSVIKDGTLYNRGTAQNRKLRSFFCETVFSFHPFVLASPLLNILLVNRTKLRLQARLPRQSREIKTWFEEAAECGVICAIAWKVYPVDVTRNVLPLVGVPGYTFLEAEFDADYRLDLANEPPDQDPNIPTVLQKLGAGSTLFAYAGVRVEASIKMRPHPALKMSEQLDFIHPSYLRTSLYLEWQQSPTDSSWGLKATNPAQWAPAPVVPPAPEYTKPPYGRIFDELQSLSGEPDGRVRIIRPMTLTPRDPEGNIPGRLMASSPCVADNYLVKSQAGESAPMPTGSVFQAYFLGPSKRAIDRLNRLSLYTALFGKEEMSDDRAAVKNRASIVTLFSKPGAGAQRPDFKMLFTGDAYDGSCDITDTVVDWELRQAKLQPNPVRLYDVLKVPHHGSTHTADAEFYQAFRAKVYIVSAMHSAHGAPTYEALHEIAAGFRWNAAKSGGGAPPEYYLFFSDPETMTDFKVKGKQSNLARLFRESRVRPRFLLPDAEDDGDDYYPYHCFRLRRTGDEGGADGERTSGRILLGRDANGNLTVHVDAIHEDDELVDVTLQPSNVTVKRYNPSAVAQGEWVWINPTNYPPGEGGNDSDSDEYVPMDE